ncbi:hypothetical protein EYF80_063970 [Liparis tanakae]|uniref:Uncharacterized protein n=1 Tax=Liparis tanakae TaxID=230148 RepID=A0A4Z2EAZ1_9TELE|nr:hypothetical protein EYF80_063970 [Liparis tanakae]
MRNWGQQQEPGGSSRRRDTVSTGRTGRQQYPGSRSWRRDTAEVVGLGADSTLGAVAGDGTP